MSPAIMDNAFACMLTAPGVGGISVIEVRGAGVPRRLAPDLRPPPPARADFVHVCRVVHHDSILDEIVVADHSMAGETVWRLQCHGGEAVRAALRQWLADRGIVWRDAPPPAAGFSARALQDLPLATTRMGALSLLAQTTDLNGRFLGAWTRRLRENTPDWPSLREEWLAYGRRSRALHRLLVPARVAIAGRPNAGKSSLFNALLDNDRVIVSEIPGTTIDVVAMAISFDQVPVYLLDTPGLRQNGGLVETLGRVKSREAIAAADFVLHLLPAGEPLTMDDEALMRLDGRKQLRITSKADLGRAPARDTDADVSIHDPDSLNRLKSLLARRLTEDCALPLRDAAAWEKDDLDRIAAMERALSTNAPDTAALLACAGKLQQA